MSYKSPHCDVEKLVVDLWLVPELVLDGVKIAEAICDAEEAGMILVEESWHVGVVGERGRPAAQEPLLEKE